MKKTYFTFLLSLTVLVLFSQGRLGIDTSSEALRMSSDVSQPVAAAGTPYINKKFLPVKVKGYDNQLFTGRFNAYNGEMEVNLGSKIIALDKLKPYELIFTQNKKVYRTYKYTTPSGVNKSGFLSVVNESKKYSLLKEEVIKYYDKVTATSTYQKDKPAKFKRENDNYYFKFENSIKYLPTKKKDLLKVFPKNTKEIKSFLKENKISFKKEEDLIKVASFLSTL